MNIEKQIDEMAKDMCEYYYEGTCYQDKKPCDCKCDIFTDAQYLYAKGYRKASDVAREIFAEIERFLYMHFRFCKEEIGNDDTEYVKGRLELNTQMQNLIAELKKKYTEDK